MGVVGAPFDVFAGRGNLVDETGLGNCYSCSWTHESCIYLTGYWSAPVVVNNWHELPDLPKMCAPTVPGKIPENYFMQPSLNDSLSGVRPFTNARCRSGEFRRFPFQSLGAADRLREHLRHLQEDIGTKSRPDHWTQRIKAMDKVNPTVARGAGFTMFRVVSLLLYQTIFLQL